jgi:hypothetical protein
MTNQFIERLGTLSVDAATHVSDEVKAYEPKLKAAAEKIASTLHDWTDRVDEWVESHFDPAAEKVRQEAGAAYRAAVQEAHALADEVKAKL